VLEKKKKMDTKMVRRNDDGITKQALQWTSQGRRCRDTKKYFKRDHKTEMWMMDFTLQVQQLEEESWKMEASVLYRTGWRRVVCGLSALGETRHSGET